MKSITMRRCHYRGEHKGMNRSKFLDHAREVIRRSQFSYSTEKTCISWIYRFLSYHRKKHPGKIGGKEIT
jgi:hypothetical protein